MKIFLIALMVVFLAGCAGQQLSVKYVDITPTQIGAAVYWKDTDPGGLGLIYKGCDRYLIENGKATLVHSDAASAPGPAQQLIGTAEGSAAASTVAGGIISVLNPTSKTSVTVTPSK